jgi:hypothetical protein
MLAFAAPLVLGGSAAAAPPLSAGLSPTIVAGGADLNGDGAVTTADDANAFYGDTSIIDGLLDCNAWVLDNDGLLGDGVINANDDCTMVGVDGTPDGVDVDVVDGVQLGRPGQPRRR